MNKLLALALLCITSWCMATPAHAAPTSAAATAERPAQARAQQPRVTVRVRYTGFYYGAGTPRELARLVRFSLGNDGTGRTMLDAAKCRRDGSCAAPINYVESLRAHDPRGNWTLQNLADKLDRLVIECNFEGRYQMDRLILRGNASLGETDVNGMSRAFEPRECAWVNPDTGRPVLAENCANPIGVRVDLDCVYHDIEVRSQSEFALIWARYDRTDDECFAYRRVDRLFQADSPTAIWHSMPRGCIGSPCDLSADNAILGRQQMTQGLIPVEPGRYQVRVARNAFLLYCLKFNSAAGVQSSFAVGVRWQQDYRLVGREWHARIYYESDQMLAENRRLNGPGGIAFYASNREMEAQMRAGYER